MTTEAPRVSVMFAVRDRQLVRFASEHAGRAFKTAGVPSGVVYFSPRDALVFAHYLLAQGVELFVDASRYVDPSVDSPFIAAHLPNPLRGYTWPE